MKPIVVHLIQQFNNQLLYFFSVRKTILCVLVPICAYRREFRFPTSQNSRLSTKCPAANLSRF